MQVQAVDDVFRHDVDPAVGHNEFTILKVKLKVIGEGFNVSIDLLLQIDECRRHPFVE